MVAASVMHMGTQPVHLREKEHSYKSMAKLTRCKKRDFFNMMLDQKKTLHVSFPTLTTLLTFLSLSLSIALSLHSTSFLWSRDSRIRKPPVCARKNTARALSLPRVHLAANLSAGSRRRKFLRALNLSYALSSALSL
jgi:hypothetical protein